MTALLGQSPGRAAKREALPELRRAVVAAFLVKRPLAPHAGGSTVSFSASRSRENRESYPVFLHPLGVFYGTGGVQTCSGSVPPIPWACLCRLCPAAFFLAVLRGSRTRRRPGLCCPWAKMMGGWGVWRCVLPVSPTRDWRREGLGFCFCLRSLESVLCGTGSHASLLKKQKAYVCVTQPRLDGAVCLTCLNV